MRSRDALAGSAAAPDRRVSVDERFADRYGFVRMGSHNGFGYHSRPLAPSASEQAHGLAVRPDVVPLPPLVAVPPDAAAAVPHRIPRHKSLLQQSASGGGPGALHACADVGAIAEVAATAAE